MDFFQMLTEAETCKDVLTNAVNINKGLPSRYFDPIFIGILVGNHKLSIYS